MYKEKGSHFFSFNTQCRGNQYLPYKGNYCWQAKMNDKYVYYRNLLGLTYGQTYSQFCENSIGTQREVYSPFAEWRI